MIIAKDGLLGHIESCKAELTPSQRRKAKICALVELGALSGRQRDEVCQAFSGEPCFQQSELKNLRELGPWMFESCRTERLINDLLPMAEAGFHALMLLHRPLKLEASLVGRACVVTDSEQETQILRYYAPSVFPVIHRQSDQDWHQGLFAGLSHWWIPGADGWVDYLGRWESPASDAVPFSGIELSPHLLAELSSDPLALELLAVLERDTPTIFPVSCPGIRFSMVDQALSLGRRAGLSSAADLGYFVSYSIANGKEATDTVAFQQAIQLAQGSSTPLAEVVRTTMMESRERRL